TLRCAAGSRRPAFRRGMPSWGSVLPRLPPSGGSTTRIAVNRTRRRTAGARRARRWPKNIRSDTANRPRRPASSRGSRAILRVVRKGSANLASDLSAELGEQITVREGGRARQISKQRALIKSLMAKALQGDVRATTALLALYARVISEPPDDDSG